MRILTKEGTIPILPLSLIENEIRKTRIGRGLKVLWLSDTARKPLYTSVSSAPPRPRRCHHRRRRRRRCRLRLPDRGALRLFKLDSSEEEVDKAVEENWTVFRTTRLRTAPLHGKPFFRFFQGTCVYVCGCAHATTCAILRFRLRHPWRRTFRFQVVQDR